MQDQTISELSNEQIHSDVPLDSFSTMLWFYYYVRSAVCRGSRAWGRGSLSLSLGCSQALGFLQDKH